MSPAMAFSLPCQRAKGRHVSRSRVVRAGARRPRVRGARRALHPGAGLGVPARQGLRGTDGGTVARVLRGVGVRRRGSIQERDAERRVHGDRQGRVQARLSAAGRGLRRRLVSEPDAPLPVEPAELGFERIRYEKAPPRATITLDRPEVLNAFDFKMLRELARACEDASWDDDSRVVVVTGEGAAFCVGADLRSWGAELIDNPREYWKWFGAFKDMHDRLREIGKPTVARVQGIAVGGGNELQMACDLAVMVDDAFIRHVGPEHGSVPAGGATQWLPIFVGDRRAREILLLCDEIPAHQAEEWGLVNRVVPAAELDAAVDYYVQSLARKLPQTTRYARQHLNFWRDFAWHQTINHARDWLALSMATEEPREAIKKFLEKK